MWELDDHDGLKREIVHDWTLEKHSRLRAYVSISRQTRLKYARNAPAYIDLYCGTGRARVEETGEIIDGGALVATKEAGKQAAFGQVHIGDLAGENVQVCETRLLAAEVTRVIPHTGPAEQTAKAVAAQLNPFGLHLAFLDPYSLAALPFTVIETLGVFRRMDLLIHVSEMDLQRDAIGKMEYDKLDVFAPGWHNVVDVAQRPNIVKRQILDHWLSKVRDLGYSVRDTSIERVTGGNNQPLYWLVFASKNSIADEFWDKIRNVHPQGRLL
jgi:three-Cys-motif partner protein